MTIAIVLTPFLHNRGAKVQISEWNTKKKKKKNERKCHRALVSFAYRAGENVLFPLGILRKQCFSFLFKVFRNERKYLRGIANDSEIRLTEWKYLLAPLCYASVTASQMPSALLLIFNFPAGDLGPCPRSIEQLFGALRTIVDLSSSLLSLGKVQTRFVFALA